MAKLLTPDTQTFAAWRDLIAAKGKDGNLKVGYETTAHYVPRYTAFGEGAVIIRHHGLAIAKFLGDGGTLLVSNAGYYSRTTKDRLNVLLGRHRTLRQVNGEWLIAYAKAHHISVPFNAYNFFECPLAQEVE